MNNIADFIESLLRDYFNISIPNIHITDILEITIISVFLYKLFKWMKSTRAWMLIRGIIVVIGFFFLAAVLQMSTILWIGEKLLNAGLIAFVVVFQPELRKALEQLGRQGLFKIVPTSWNKTTILRFSDQTKNEIIKATMDMAARKVGSLIVIEQEVMLQEYVRTGIDIDAIVSRQLLVNMFEKNTPLHDGAVIVRGNRVVSATCYLPLTENLELNKALGTRHRAAIGISEVSDAVTIVVSEETGMISVTKDGNLYHDLGREELSKILSKAQIIKIEHDKKAKESDKGTKKKDIEIADSKMSSKDEVKKDTSQGKEDKDV